MHMSNWRLNQGSVNDSVWNGQTHKSLAGFHVGIFAVGRESCSVALLAKVHTSRSFSEME